MSTAFEISYFTETWIYMYQLYSKTTTYTGNRERIIQSETDNILEDIANKCKEFQRFTVPPVRVKISLQTKENLALGDEVSINPMFIDNAPILHVGNTSTLLSASKFLYNQCKT